MGLIGRGIANSKMPAIQEFGLKQAGLRGSYSLLDVSRMDVEQTDSDACAALVRECLARNLCGFNVTMPFKLVVLPHLDALSPAAKAIGSVNTVVVHRCSHGESPWLVGHNTDCVGWENAITDAFPRERDRARALARVALVGAGGAGRAVAVALLQQGCAHLVLTDAMPELAEGLAADLRLLGWPGVTARTGEKLEAVMASCTGAVNASPVGMLGFAVGSHSMQRFPSSVCWAGDTVYTPRITPFIALAQRQGLTSVLGESMWLGQAMASFEIMTGSKLGQRSRSKWSQEAHRLLVKAPMSGPDTAHGHGPDTGTGTSRRTSTCMGGRCRPDGVLTSKL